MIDTIELHLKAVDFKGTDYICEQCAIEKAIHRQTGARFIIEQVDKVELDKVEYNHSEYNYDHFEADKALATSLNFDNTTIRTITLTKV